MESTGMNNTEIFTGKSKDDFRCRPSYPLVAIDWLRARCPGERVHGIGTPHFYSAELSS